FSVVNFTSPRIAFFLVLALYLYVQLYLFRRIQGSIDAKIRPLRRRKMLSAAAAAFFVFMLLPLIWIVVFGLIQSPSPSAIKTEMTLLFAIWATGSVGSALVLGGYDVLKRALARLPRPAKAPDLERRE